MGFFTKAVAGQWLRWAIKRSVWTPLTSVFKVINQPLQSVQVLVVDRPRKLVLLLRTPEAASGYFPVQGLRKRLHWLPAQAVYYDDPREDARRELIEEAVDDKVEESLLPLEKFRLLHRYWEGGRGQFDCRVYLLEVDSQAIPLREAGSEGLPLWMRVEDAQTVLKEPLGALLNELPPENK